MDGMKMPVATTTRSHQPTVSARRGEAPKTARTENDAQKSAQGQAAAGVLNLALRTLMTVEQKPDIQRRLSTR